MIKEKIHFKILIPLFLILFISGCTHRLERKVYYPKHSDDYKLNEDEAVLLDSIQHKTFLFFMNSVQSPDTNVTGYQGFYYHFLRMNSATREWNCELSTIDTGLLMMGIIFARNYYNQNNELENEIRDIAAKLIGRMNWDFFQMPETG